MKSVIPFLFASAFVGGVTILACGSGTNGSSAFTPVPDAGSSGGDATVPPNNGTDSGPQTFGGDGGLEHTEAGAVNTSCPNPTTCLSLGITCGSAGDGCGNTIQCGTCTSPQTCGGGGQPSVCGDSTPCQPKTCADIDAGCGQQGDGCGNVIQCGNCTLPNTCGGGGSPNQCGVTAQAADAGPPPQCTPQTCTTANANCGQVSDGCGGLTPSCGSCAPPAICGGGGVPNQCGDSNLDGGVGTCTNLCLQIPTCAAGATTTITGTVVAPTPSTYGTPDPLYGALVYIPNSPNGQLDPFPTTVTCDSCNAQASGDPLVSTTSAADGTFTLTGVPAGQNIPIVYQLGRWRREFIIPQVNACTTNTLTTDQTRFARKQAETTPYDNIPLTAMVTGSVDALECVLRKIGVDDTQFGDPSLPWASGAPRIQIYTGTPSKHSTAVGGASYDSKTPGESALWSSASTLEAYDQVLLACQGGADTRTTTALANMQTYANAGGRVYATHYSYDWIFSNSPWNSTADWTDPNTGNDPNDPTTGIVDTSFTKGQAFAQWLVYSGASTTAGQVPISVSRNDFFQPINAPGQQWIYTANGNADSVTHSNALTDAPLHYTFDTPTTSPAAQQCGRVLYSDFHVTDVNTSPKTDFPAECNTSPMTAQEKVLEFMIFDLDSCIDTVPPPKPPTCTPLACPTSGVDGGTICGPMGDGCGNVIQCGNCGPGEACGAGGQSTCGPTSNKCTPLACPAATDAGLPCGEIGDGCGNLIPCGTCPTGQTCGGGGIANVCGAPPCTPAKCDAQQTCGTIADGCGGTTNCGTCTPPDTCGGGGTPNQCGNNGVK